jgi:hypothetical protein
MNTLKIDLLDRCSNSCKFCSHYQPEGRRDGHCGKLQVSVGGNWQSCSLMELAFNSGDRFLSTSLESEFRLIATDTEKQLTPNSGNSAQNSDRTKAYQYDPTYPS